MDNEIPPPPVETPVEETPKTPPPAPPANAPAPPPVAALVLNGEKSEREIVLERELETERARAKRAEIVAAEKELENQRLKEIPAPPKPPKVKRGRTIAEIILGDEEEE